MGVGVACDSPRLSLLDVGGQLYFGDHHLIIQIIQNECHFPQ